MPAILKVEVETLPGNVTEDQADADNPGGGTPRARLVERRTENIDLMDEEERTSTGYILQTDGGNVTVRRVSEEELEDDTNAEGEQAEPPGARQRAMADKIRSTRRSRSNPEDFPQAGQALNEILKRKRAQAQAQSRDKNGRFLPRSNSESDKN